MKAFFRNDYGEGAHPLVMQRLLETDLEHTCGYGLDEYSLRAAELIREKMRSAAGTGAYDDGRNVRKRHCACRVPASV
ncbi:MAG: hypothetical protein V8Q88_12420 [Christensenellales bacterium]